MSEPLIKTIAFFAIVVVITAITIGLCYLGVYLKQFIGGWGIVLAMLPVGVGLFFGVYASMK